MFTSSVGCFKWYWICKGFCKFNMGLYPFFNGTSWPIFTELCCYWKWRLWKTILFGLVLLLKETITYVQGYYWGQAVSLGIVVWVIPGNYMKFYEAIKLMYPDISIISNCDGSSKPLDHPADIYDFHVWFLFSVIHIVTIMSRS